jgi:16S rRNA (cytosine967-C5)-methyltransferase
MTSASGKSGKSVARTRPGGPGRAQRGPTQAGPEPLEALMAEVLKFDWPADGILRRFFAAHREMGMRDRARVAETVFDVLRNRRLYAHLAQAGTGPMPARLIALSRGRDRIDTSGVRQDIRLSLPDWLFERLAARLPAPQLESLGQALLEPAPLDLRINPMKADRDVVVAALRAAGLECAPLPLGPLAIRVQGKPALEKTEAFRQGMAEVQDCGSQLIAHLVAPRRGQTVIDFCAGAGGKTLALAAMMRGTGQVFACDVSAPRLQRLHPRLARSGASNVQPFGIDSEHDRKLDRLAGRADAVLVDAPCSGTGTLRRNPDLKWRMNEAAIGELTAKQRSILDAAARLVRPGGVLVYATCSLLDEENDGVRRWFEQTHPGWRCDPAGEVLQRQGASIEPPLEGDCLQLRPDLHGTDAFYAVRWIRGGT